MESKPAPVDTKLPSTTAGSSWHTLCFSEHELDIDITLSSGQIFSWHALPGFEVEWRGVISDRLCTLKQSSSHEIAYQFHPSRCVPSRVFDHASIIAKFFRLDGDTNLTSMLKEWSERDPILRGKSSICKGVRVLRVAALEALLSFICSANNNISRITHMVHTLCSTFGRHIATVGGQRYHSFPTLESLHCTDCEAKLRSLGFGYRAKYIDRCVHQILDRGGEKWLHSLQDLEYEEARRLLRELSGVGPKVADCVCLIGLGHLEAVPVDTHMLRVSARDYGLKVPHSLTDRSYSLVGQHYRALFGDTAGWAQAVLFASEIQELKSRKRKAPTESTSNTEKRPKTGSLNDNMNTDS